MNYAMDIAYWIIAEKYAMSTVFGHFVESGQNYDDGSPVWVIFTEEPSKTAVTVLPKTEYRLFRKRNSKSIRKKAREKKK